MHEEDQPTQGAVPGSRAAPEGRSARRDDDRRTPVSPTDNPRPTSPDADEESVRKGEETLERVKPY